MTALRLSDAQKQALRMADLNYIRRDRDGVWRGVGDYGLTHLHPDNETTLRTINSLMSRGFMGEASTGDDVVFALPSKGRWVMQQVGP